MPETRVIPDSITVEFRAPQNIERQVLERELKRDKRRNTVLPLPEDREAYPFSKEPRGIVALNDEDVEFPDADDEDTYEEFMVMCSAVVERPRLESGGA